MRPIILAVAFSSFLASACTDAAGPVVTRDSTTPVAALAPNGVALRVNGDGTYDAGVIVDFETNAIVASDGSARGSFRHTTALGGLPIEFVGTVTCVGHDPINNRAWIGGIITENNSTHSSFVGDIHQPGRDIWFRVVDYGNGGSGTADRTTFVGFEGSAGIITSAEYCSTKPWPEGDARTNALLSGNLIVQ